MANQTTNLTISMIMGDAEPLYIAAIDSFSVTEDQGIFFQLSTPEDSNDLGGRIASWDQFSGSFAYVSVKDQDGVEQFCRFF